MSIDMLMLLVGIALAALLYSSIGHAGASGFLAVMAFTSYSGSNLRTTALILNLFVATIVTIQLTRHGLVRSADWVWFALGSLPTVAFSSQFVLPNQAYRQLVGIVLILSAVSILLKPILDQSRKRDPHAEPRQPLAFPMLFAIAIGAGLGILSGLTGTGGGIFLSPILILFANFEPKRCSGVTAPFILVNSAMGLASSSLAPLVSRLRMEPDSRTLGSIYDFLQQSCWTSLQSLLAIGPLIVAAMVGGIVGSWLGTRILKQTGLRVVLSIVLLIAAVKFFQPPK